MLASSPRFHLIYLTANDQPNFSIDYLNLLYMAYLSPGVEKVELTLVVSAVKPVSNANRRELDALVKLVSESPWLVCKGIIWKGNVGRDFSSAYAGLSSIKPDAVSGDYVMVRNRSAYGPFMHDWYARFVDQYTRFPDSGLVGNTINLSGPVDAPEHSLPHVQTYVYLSQWWVFSALLDDFPGLSSCDNRSAIVSGELGMSRAILAMSLRLSCLYWPDRCFCADLSQLDGLPLRDIKSEANDLPFRYKFPAYRRGRQAMLKRVFWYLRTHFPRVTWHASPGRCRVINDFGQVGGHVS